MVDGDGGRYLCGGGTVNVISLYLLDCANSTGGVVHQRCVRFEAIPPRYCHRYCHLQTRKKKSLLFQHKKKKTGNKTINQPLLNQPVQQPTLQLQISHLMMQLLIKYGNIVLTTTTGRRVRHHL
jgi:hypothetical protein